MSSADVGRFLAGRTVGFLVAPFGVDDQELEGPWSAAHDAGAEPVLIAPRLGKVQSLRDGNAHGVYDVDQTVEDTTLQDLDALVLPDGKQNTRTLRDDAAAVALIRAYGTSGKPVGAFGHAVGLMLDAGLLVGRNVTSHARTREEIQRAGGKWHDRRVVVDDNIITSRTSQDVEAFNTQMIAFLDR